MLDFSEIKIRYFVHCFTYFKNTFYNASCNDLTVLN